MKNGNEKSKFGMFVYDKSDTCLTDLNEYGDKFAGLMETAHDREGLLEKGSYLEIWERDENGCFGNDGSPLYKSDDKGEIMDKWEKRYDEMLAKIEASGKLKKNIRINLRGVDGFVIEPIMLKDLEGLLPANNNPNDSYLHTYTVIHHDRNFELPAFIDYGIRFVNRLCILYMRGEISKIANRNLSMRWHEDIIFEIQRIIFEEE